MAERSIGFLPLLHAAESLAKQQIGLRNERTAREGLNQLLKSIGGFLRFARLQQGPSRIEQRLLSRWDQRSERLGWRRRRGFLRRRDLSLNQIRDDAQEHEHHAGNGASE